MSTFDMPKRSDIDGAVGVCRMVETAPPYDDLGITINARHDGTHREIVVSRYNAARILVMLCTMLEVPCPKPLAKMTL